MPKIENPFVYEAASSLNANQIIDYYIDDHNHGRLLQSKRNVFLVGERGSGKSMALIFNSHGVQRLRAKRKALPIPLDTIGVLVPCNTPIMHKREYRLLDPFKARVVSEHFFALSIAFEVVRTLDGIPEVVDGAEEVGLREELEFILDMDIPSTNSLFQGISMAIQREIVVTQKKINDLSSTLFYDESVSFGSLVMPLLQSLSTISLLSKSHFLLLIDDAHDLNEFQIETLNSWIAYRDRSLFSFKVASARVGRPSLRTGTGGAILEGHDFIEIDLEKPLHNEESSYGKLARDIVEVRLRKCGIDRTPSEFLPVHPQFEKDLRASIAHVREQAQQRHGVHDKKKIQDHVYKYGRAEYFRLRDAKANLPLYSGFSMIVFISTGVIRNLLLPCWKMYDATISQVPKDERELGCVTEIAPSTQSRTILDESNAAWERLKTLDRTVEGCTREMAVMIHNMFDNLAAHFRARLLGHKSEPRANSFSISQRSSDVMAELDPLLTIAQKAQMLYVRIGPAKAEGRRETYYIPNRILWPIRQLDPHGQHARVSIRASTLLAAAKGSPIPFLASDGSEDSLDLFDG